jgi:hypothetical protein
MNAVRKGRCTNREVGQKKYERKESEEEIATERKGIRNTDGKKQKHCCHINVTVSYVGLLFDSVGVIVLVVRRVYCSRFM